MDLSRSEEADARRGLVGRIWQTYRSEKMKNATSFEKKEKEVLTDIAMTVGSTLGAVVATADAANKAARRRGRAVARQADRLRAQARRDVKTLKSEGRKAVRRISRAAKGRRRR
jgi:hypothetical protein